MQLMTVKRCTGCSVLLPTRIFEPGNKTTGQQRNADGGSPSLSRVPTPDLRSIKRDISGYDQSGRGLSGRVHVN